MKIDYNEEAKKLVTKMKEVLQVKFITNKLGITYITFWKKLKGDLKFNEREYEMLKELSEAKVIDFMK